MAPSIKAKINHQMLAWARRSAGLDVAAAAKKIGGANFKPERIEAWEAGNDSPTVVQLRRIARVYKRPLATFFLAERPCDFAIPRDFRRLPGDDMRDLSPELRWQLRAAEDRREVAIELYGDLGEAAPQFDLVATMQEEPEVVGQRIREALGVTVEEQAGWRDLQRYKPLHHWRAKIEELGALVFQIFDVEATEVLGFSLAEATAPIIGVNRKIRPNARIFTMLHEFVHLMLRSSSLCDIEEDFARPPEEQRVEVFCNRVAAATLVPAEEFLREPIVARQPARAVPWEDEAIVELAHRYSVSREVIVRRFLILGRTTEGFYREKRAEYRAQLEAAQRARQQSGGPESPARKVVSTQSRNFVRLVLESYHQGHITLSDVSSYLGVRVKHLPKIEQAVLAA